MSKEVVRFDNKHEGRTAYIICNGPSLRDLDWDLFKDVSKDEVTIGMNGIWPNQWSYEPDYLVCVNPLAAKRFAKDIRGAGNLLGLFVSQAAELEIFGEPQQQASVITLDTTLREMVFTRDLTKPIWEGYTVTFVALQMAYYMGCAEVVIVGMDHDFGVAGSQPNVEMISDEDDTAHFKLNYFDKGTHWNAPDLANSEVAYALARHAFEYDGRDIINASAHSKSKAFRMMPFNRVAAIKKQFEGFDGPFSPLVSAIVSAYKAEQFMEGLMKDLIQQSLRAQLEIVVVCQVGSEEERIARGYGISMKSEPSVVVVTTEDIPTVYAAWNLGIKAASGKYITNANTDDRHSVDMLETMAMILDARPDIALVYANCFITWKPNTTFDEFVTWANESDGELLVAGREVGREGIFSWAPYTLEMLRKGCFIGPQPMWRANLHQKYGYFDEGFESAGDYEFWLRIGHAGEEMLSIPQLLGLYLANPAGIELSDTERGDQETARAQMNNQHAAGAQYLGHTTDLMLLRLGRDVAYIDVRSFIEVADEMGERYHKIWKAADAKKRKDKYEAQRNKKKKAKA